MAVVLGRGSSGAAACALLEREGVCVTVLDGGDVFPRELLVPGTLCVVSPGVPSNHAWIKCARAAGLAIVSELQLGAERWLALGGRMLGVTGSKGKSSVVKLLADALGGVPCGNYGTPLCAVVNSHAEGGTLPWAVVEVSSFQLEMTELPADAFVAAALLNLQDDHLDRHGSREVYHALKRRLLRMTRVPVDGTDPSTLDPGGGALFRGSYFDNDVLRVNALCAVALLRAAGVTAPETAASFAAFTPLPHRMQNVGTFGGVCWIDDSKATSLAALAAGVSMAANKIKGLNDIAGEQDAVRSSGVLLIAGGLPKGDDPNSVISCLQFGVKKVYLIGCCADQFFDAWRESVACEVCGTLDRAVAAARRDAMPGDVVLLSPGTASFDQFKSYGDRGDAFASLVREGTGCAVV